MVTTTTIQTNGIRITQKSVLENETRKLLRDFEIQTDALTSAQGPDLVAIKNKNKNKKKREIAELWSLLFRLTTK